MHTRDPATERRTREVEPQARRTPDAPPQQLLALQRTIGNASLSRALTSARLQRLRKEDEEKWVTLGYVIEGLEHYRSLLLPTQQRWNEYHYQEFLLNRLGADVDPNIARLKTLRDEIEAENDPAAKLKEATTLANDTLKALKQINSEGQEKDRDSVTQAFDKSHLERKARLEKDLGTRKAAAAAALLEQQRLAAEQAVQNTIAATGVAPNAVGAAFNRPYGGTARDNLHTWITLSWKPFRNLLRGDIDNVNCFIYHLTLAQLNDLLGRLGDQTVAEYDYQGWPASRAPLAATAPGLVMPVRLSSMTARFGAEVFVDWVRFNAGHTGPAANLAQAFNFTNDEAQFIKFGGDVENTPDRKVYRYPTGKRLVTSAARDAVITYYNGA